MTGSIGQFVDSTSGRTSTDPFITIIAKRAPTGNDLNYKVGQRWVNNTGQLQATITGITNANPAVVTANNTFSVGQIVSISGVAGMTQINNFNYVVESTNGTSFTIDIDSTAFGTYTSGGVANANLVEEYILVGFISTGGFVQADWVLLGMQPGLDTGAVSTLSGNDGIHVPPTSGNINVVGSGNISVAGNIIASSETITLVGTTNHAIQVGNSSGSLTSLAVATNGQLPIGSAGANPVLGNLTSSGSTVNITNGPGTINLEVAGGQAIDVIVGDSGSVTGSTVNLTGSVTGLTFNGVGTVMTLGGILVLANGGTSASLIASNGGIFYSTATQGAILSGTATARQMLQSGASSSPAWSTSTWPATTTINQILYSSANNVVSEITTSDNGVLISDATGIPSWLANSGTPGFVLTANAGAPPSWQIATLPLEIWSDKAISFTAVVGNGYFTIATLTATLPASATQGQTVDIAVDSAGTVIVQASAGQTIRLAGLTSSSGGNATNTSVGDSLALVFRELNNEWFSVATEGSWILA